MENFDFKMIREKNIQWIEKVVAERKEILGLTPKLVILKANDDPASTQYTQSIKKFGEGHGIDVEVMHLDSQTSEEALIEHVHRLNCDAGVQGIMIQKPLPKNVSDQKVVEAIAESKDVEGITAKSLGKLFLGMETLLPCTPQAVIEFLEGHNIDIKGKHVVVIGRSDIVGKPLALLCLAKHATVTICHSRTEDMASHTQAADYIISAVGKYDYLKPEMVKNGVKIIDVGVNFVEDKMVGDVDGSRFESIASWVTPAKGGLGSITTSILFKNLLLAWMKND